MQVMPDKKEKIVCPNLVRKKRKYDIILHIINCVLSYPVFFIIHRR